MESNSDTRPAAQIISVADWRAVCSPKPQPQPEHTMPNCDGWRGCLAAYLAAKRQRGTTERAFNRSQRTFLRLVKRMGGERAYFIAGCNMADRANLKAHAAVRAAYEGLIQSLAGAPLQDRISALSAIYATRLPAPANSNFELKGMAKR